MTVSTTLAGTSDRDVLMADERDQRQAKELAKKLPITGARFSAESAGEVPAELSAIIAQVVQAVAAGHTVTVNAMPEELTTTAAAKLLGISRPTLMRKIKADEIPAHKVGTHTRVRTSDVLAEQRARRQRQIAAFDELRALEEED
ncbi:helix-turn-helix domain-containing protein [Amycolatopsis sp. FDAARGOS 1241]|uniref:helix-turn-helix domain-containing protein n=1 Tax=Amycolatopsis sp. FDAARGOS 1241 TaxID=2778070 RepID=UPI0019523B7F|nr:helix-turn-helix domain-containing protein [Amycolatopsis sp. FDAARGOS 1241]QRP49039.1 helix-turn-helix domain-containing protein [Amycolatopsis sp. FDAARGOS 1241]